jgi:hypothetical protein
MGRNRVCMERRKAITMGTKIRAEISLRNKYYISRHRYYELKHFCLQYPEWKKAYNAIDDMLIPSPNLDKVSSSNELANPTERCALAKAYYANRIEMIERAAMDADSELYDYILKAVTEDLSFTHLKTKLEIPCGKDMYYDRYRKFFWILSNVRQ